MSHDATYQLRIDEATKQQSFEVFRSLGMTPAEGMRIFLRQVVQTKSIPFAIGLPNASTQKALLADPASKDYKRFDSVDALFADLND